MLYSIFNFQIINTFYRESKRMEIKTLTIILVLYILAKMDKYEIL